MDNEEQKTNPVCDAIIRVIEIGMQIATLVLFILASKTKEDLPQTNELQLNIKESSIADMKSINKDGNCDEGYQKLQSGNILFEWDDQAICVKYSDNGDYSNFFQKLKKDCTNQEKNCGIADTQNQYLCIAQNESCPINYISRNLTECKEGIDEDCKVLFNGTNYKLYFTNLKTGNDGKIISNIVKKDVKVEGLRYTDLTKFQGSNLYSTTYFGLKIEKKESSSIVGKSVYDINHQSILDGKKYSKICYILTIVIVGGSFLILLCLKLSPAALACSCFLNFALFGMSIAVIVLSIMNFVRFNRAIRIKNFISDGYYDIFDSEYKNWNNSWIYSLVSMIFMVFALCLSLLLILLGCIIGCCCLCFSEAFKQ